MMKTLGMGASHRLNVTNINRYVRMGRIGNYALGYKEDDIFYVCYVGRSDTDLNVRLKEHIDENSDYEYFKFKYAETVADAYMTECRNFHDFPNENNKNHPAKPEDYVGKCPVCSE